MNEKTLTALQGAIKKWERIVAGELVDRGAGNCPLCKLFFDEGCEGCPVMDATGDDCCDGSPYERWCSYHYDNGRVRAKGEYKVTDESSKRLAQAEVDFLRSLLPDAQHS